MGDKIKKFVKIINEFSEVIAALEKLIIRLISLAGWIAFLWLAIKAIK